MTLDEIKNKIAIQKGYAGWDDYYNWVARDGALPEVTAQLIEASMRDACELYASKFADCLADSICKNVKLEQEYKSSYFAIDLLRNRGNILLSNISSLELKCKLLEQIIFDRTELTKFDLELLLKAKKVDE